jgi:ligand-binding sensor domain-containing protein
MEQLIDALRDFSPVQLTIILGGFWWMTSNIKKEIRQEIAEIRKETTEIRHANQKQTERTDKLYEMFIELIKNAK